MVGNGFGVWDSTCVESRAAGRSPKALRDDGKTGVECLCVCVSVLERVSVESKG